MKPIIGLQNAILRLYSHGVDSLAARVAEMTDKEFDSFCVRHREPTLKYALSLGCRIEDAEDLAHEVLFDVWRNGQRCPLQTMVRQRVIKRGRRRARMIVPASSPDRATYDTAEQVHVDDALRSLPAEADRQLAALKYQGATNADIARQLGITRAAVGKRMRKLRQALSDWR
jgi:RNA polymerase sigma factor (sigma-70 family)